MAEYIEREALIADIEENLNTYWNEGHGGYYLAEDALEESVKMAPTADVVEVVRCKDCCFGEEKVDVGGIIRVCTLRDDNRFAVLGTDFCNYGVKMDGKGEGE